MCTTARLARAALVLPGLRPGETSGTRAQTRVKNMKSERSRRLPASGHPHRESRPAERERVVEGASALTAGEPGGVDAHPRCHTHVAANIEIGLPATTPRAQ